jgi:4-diphosphocytidyl-2-C-methyl-D-erythritol kinase
LNATSLSLPSFAKINWHLQVLGKRSDGYHEVLTVLQTVSLCDQLTFDLRDDGKIVLTCDDPGIPADDTNLIVKAAVALRKRLGSSLGAGRSRWRVFQRGRDSAGAERAVAR